MTPIALVVHATHEAGYKIGGIGAVLDGLLGSPAYNAAVTRTIVVGPLDPWNPDEMERLTAPRNRLQIIYSSIHGVNEASEALADRLRDIEARMNVRLLYGMRHFAGVDHEVILVDALGIAGEVINTFKFYLWQHWGLPQSLETIREYSFHLNAAEPLHEAIEAVTADLPPVADRYIIAHEWLGLPVAFSAILHAPRRYKTVFYAHEVATARQLVEEHGGHDTRFYNALRLGMAQGNRLDQVFGDQSWFYKHAMIQRAGVCDRLFAVGDLVVDELRFLGGVFRTAGIDLVYNGVPAPPVSLEQKLASRELLQQYAENLLGYRPDYVFSHVSRMVLSKAFWRDIRVLEHLEWTLATRGQTAVLFVVSTAQPTGRRPEDIFRWEREYGWPVSHRADNGDLQGAEADFFFRVIEPFHWGRHAIRVVLINQFGFDRSRCGLRMPESMSFADLRLGADVEFGQSIYEPFGIAQVEPLAAGALCVVSNVCGCVGFVGRAAGGPTPNLIVADYTGLPPGWSLWSAWDALRIDQFTRNGIEAYNSLSVAQQVADRLPHDDSSRRLLLEEGQRVAQGMSWDVVARDYLLPALGRC
jgi:hypothetical protein